MPACGCASCTLLCITPACCSAPCSAVLLLDAFSCRCCVLLILFFAYLWSRCGTYAFIYQHTQHGACTLWTTKRVRFRWFMGRTPALMAVESMACTAAPACVLGWALRVLPARTACLCLAWAVCLPRTGISKRSFVRACTCGFLFASALPSASTAMHCPFIHVFCLLCYDARRWDYCTSTPA